MRILPPLSVQHFLEKKYAHLRWLHQDLVGSLAEHPARLPVRPMTVGELAGLASPGRQLPDLEPAGWELVSAPRPERPPRPLGLRDDDL